MRLYRYGKQSVNPFDPEQVKTKTLSLLRESRDLVGDFVGRYLEGSKKEKFLAQFMNENFWKACDPVTPLASITNPFDPKQVKTIVSKLTRDKNGWVADIVKKYVADPKTVEEYIDRITKKDFWESFSYETYPGDSNNERDLLRNDLLKAFITQEVNRAIKTKDWIDIIPSKEISVVFDYKKNQQNPDYREIWHIDPSENGIWTNNPQSQVSKTYTLVFSENVHAGTKHVLFPYFTGTSYTVKKEENGSFNIDLATYTLWQFLLNQKTLKTLKPYVAQTTPGQLYEFAIRCFHTSPKESLFSYDSRRCFVLRHSPGENE